MKWSPDGAVAFRKTAESYGFLSNMAAGFPLLVAGREWKTSEALYQAARFPNVPDLQEQIRMQASPMAAKMVTKPYRSASGRPDWDAVRVEVMRWVIRVKVLQGGDFGARLAETGERPIIEDSHKDRFWGAVFSHESGFFVGENWLGRLLMDVRGEVGSIAGARRVRAPRCGVVLFAEAVGETLVRAPQGDSQLSLDLGPDP